MAPGNDPVFELRRMRPSDLSQVMDIERRSFANPWSEATFRGEIQNTGISFPLVAFEPETGTVLGYIIYWLVGDEVQINNVAVHPDSRRRGVGESMLKAALDNARDRGGTHAVLEVRMSNAPARTLYEKKFGFTTLSVREGYYTNPAEDALVLGRAL